ncbi:Lon-like ATP-dependent protease [Gammaproteobacteria bacterium]
MLNPLSPEVLLRRCSLEHLPFQTTAELADLDETVGQNRALEAIHFGVGMRHAGYNLYVLGPPGHGKHNLVQTFLAARAATSVTPSDWCYVHNFQTPHKPRTLRLPAGQGTILRRDLERLLEELQRALSAAFENDEYRHRVKEIEDISDKRQEHALKEVQKQAEYQEIALLNVRGNFSFAPLRGGKVISPEVFAKFPEQEREQIEAVIDDLQKRLNKVLHELPGWVRETRLRIKEIKRAVILNVVGHLIDETKKSYPDLPAVLTYLDEIQQDLIENAEELRGYNTDGGDGKSGDPFQPKTRRENNDLRRYYINTLVHHDSTAGAPVVYEDNPTYQALVGRIEHTTQMGTLLTDFSLIKAGALHRANGGYLLLDARKLLMQPFAWEALKRALHSREIRIEPLGQWLSLVNTEPLEPEPIPLTVKVVLIGERVLYYLLHAYDPEFSALFKVVADFEDKFPRLPENDLLYARLIATLARREGLFPLTQGACAVVIEQAARLAEDSERLTLHVQAINDLLCEANWWASEARRELVTATDVECALAAQKRRCGRIRDQLFDEVLRGTVYIDTTGSRVGQVNVLSVIQLGAIDFGHPSRVTATVHAGEGHVVDIEREVELGGPLHTKGVLILSAFLAARYAHRRPLSLGANLVFEQSYGEIEGDSASLAELCALLSSLADVPIHQSLALTGSVNQHGEVQPIGGVNEKIEGFFELCTARGLTGKQGVLIPATNVKHLMLHANVIEAAAAGRFRIYAVATVDEAVELLTDLPAGERNIVGAYSPGSFNYRVETRLARFSETRIPRGAERSSLSARRPLSHNETEQ